MRFLASRQPVHFDQVDQDAADGLIVAGFDVGASQVQAALISIEVSRSRILSQASAQLPQASAGGDLASAPAAFQAACREALRLARRPEIPQPRSMVLGISSDMIKGVTQLLRVERPNPRLPLVEAELDKLLLQNQAEALAAANASIGLEHQAEKVEFQLLNSSLVSVQVDGRRLANPLNYQARSVSLEVYNAFVPRDWLEAGQQIAEHLNLSLIALAYRPFALAKGFLAGQPQPDLKALIINVGEHLTDLAIIEEGVLRYSQHFPLGSEHFDRCLQRRLGLDRSDLAALRAPGGDFELAELGEERQARAAKALSLAALVWLQGISLSLKDLKLGSLPAKIYLSGSGAGLSCISESLSKPNWAELVALDGPAEINRLGTGAMPSVSSELEGAEAGTLATLAGLGCLAGDILNVVQNGPEEAAQEADSAASAAREQQRTE